MIGPGYITPIVKNLLIINALLFLATWVSGGILYPYLALFPPGHEAFQPYQFITYMFMHGGLGHIFFNMFGLWMFGSDVEQYWGPKKFLTFYLATGIGAALIYLAVDLLRGAALGTMVGASGALMGVLAAFGFMFPNRQLMLIFFPVPIKAKYFVMLYGAIDLYAGLRGSPGDNVAHFAHLGGLLTGLIFLLVWRQQGKLYTGQL